MLWYRIRMAMTAAEEKVAALARTHVSRGTRPNSETLVLSCECGTFIAETARLHWTVEQVIQYGLTHMKVCVLAHELAA